MLEGGGVEGGDADDDLCCLRFFFLLDDERGEVVVGFVVVVVGCLGVMVILGLAAVGWGDGFLRGPAVKSSSSATWAKYWRSAERANKSPKTSAYPFWRA